MSKPDTWYVAFGPDRTARTETRTAGPARTTKTFKSEVDAKVFAREVIAKGFTATAGTLNPHQPKRTIAAAQIEDWINLDQVD